MAGGGPNSVCADASRLDADPLGDGQRHRRRLRIGSEAKARQHALQGGGAQCLGGAVTGPPRSVQPAAAFHGLGRAHHDRQILGDQRSDAAAPPQRDEQHGEAQLQTIHLT